MLVDELADFLTNELGASGPSSSSSSSTSSAPSYADTATGAPLATKPASHPRGWILIHDAEHPWVAEWWPPDVPLPPGYVKNSDVPARWEQRKPKTTAANQVYLPNEATAEGRFSRLSAEAAWQDTLASLPARDALTAEQITQAEKKASRVVPGAELPRPPRAPRKPRAPRAPRPPRAPRKPREPRMPGTKNSTPKRQCRRRNSLGQCVDGIRCIPGASIPEPNVGHSSCNWGPVDSCGNCVGMGCDSTNFHLLEPLLKILPVKWTQESVAAANAPRPVPGAPPGSLLAKAKLPPIGIGGIQGNPQPYPVDKRALVSGCGCNVWPWWIICANCSGSPKCTCPGECNPLPPNSGNCQPYTWG